MTRLKKLTEALKTELVEADEYDDFAQDFGNKGKIVTATVQDQTVKTQSTAEKWPGGAPVTKLLDRASLRPTRIGGHMKFLLGSHKKMYAYWEDAGWWHACDANLIKQTSGQPLSALF